MVPALIVCPVVVFITNWPFGSSFLRLIWLEFEPFSHIIRAGDPGGDRAVAVKNQNINEWRATLDQAKRLSAARLRTQSQFRCIRISYGKNRD